MMLIALIQMTLMTMGMVTLSRDVRDNVVSLTLLVPKQTRSVFKRMFGMSEGFETEIEHKGETRKLWMECDTDCHCVAALHLGTAFYIPQWSGQRGCVLVGDRDREHVNHCIAYIGVRFQTFLEDFAAILRGCQIFKDIPMDDMRNAIEPVSNLNKHTYTIPKTMGSWMGTSIFVHEGEKPIAVPPRHVYAISCDQSPTNFDICACTMTLFSNTLGGRHQITCDTYKKGSKIEVASDLAKSRARSISGEPSPGAIRRRSSTLSKPSRDFSGNCRVQVDTELLLGALQRGHELADRNGRQHPAYDQVCSSLPVNIIMHDPISEDVPQSRQYVILRSNREEEHHFPIVEQNGAVLSCTFDCTCFIKVDNQVKQCTTIYSARVIPLDQCVVLSFENICATMK